MRNKLIELIHECEVEALKANLHLSPERIADYLLEKGVIVPPCEVGHTMYVTDIIAGKIVECEIISIKCFAGEDVAIIEYKAPKEIPNIVSYESPSTEIGETLFLTREEAEKAIAERGCKDV